MEPCEGFVQTDLCLVQVTIAPNFYTNLRFSILASTGFSRALGVLLWSVFHVLVLLVVLPVLLVAFIAVLLLSLFADATMIMVTVCLVLVGSFTIGVVDVVVLVCLATGCRCCTLPPRAAGQSRRQYFLSAAGRLCPERPPQAPADDVHELAPQSKWESVKGLLFIFGYLEHVELVSIPFWRLKLWNLCRDIVPLTDHIVIK